MVLAWHGRAVAWCLPSWSGDHRHAIFRCATDSRQEIVYRRSLDMVAETRRDTLRNQNRTTCLPVCNRLYTCPEEKISYISHMATPRSQLYNICPYIEEDSCGTLSEQTHSVRESRRHTPRVQRRSPESAQNGHAHCECHFTPRVLKSV